MSILAVQRKPRSLFPEFPELFAGFPALAGLRPVFDSRVMRLEDGPAERHVQIQFAN
ncbi:hypothetical protein [Mycobacterium shigaense]|uniref:Alpha-crystallin n=1 Tax=Mycobacterium shigaense TaxID=722731 RepID=A0A1Z4EJ41_9MYCO|nr:alpha-crystallin [Mycobacterium shigaense]